ncbi:hypothetical protein BDV96DRAFT_691868 [Lophiotrema nucula]|uniref:Uncharacterized protein n=1 Tax=Lophiotrema nucula TaxID=690887 RepID=A0A6A5YTH7_9PLEO|nr:hypothetical protein BDV96DRAFT_691868 [Lophiotrema nucula]
MASFNTLPEEIIDQIVSHFSYDPAFFAKLGCQSNKIDHIVRPDYAKNQIVLSSLSLVSKKLHRIVEPHLYRVIKIVVAEPGEGVLTRSVSLLYRTLLWYPKLSDHTKVLLVESKIEIAVPGLWNEGQHLILENPMHDVDQLYDRQRRISHCRSMVGFNQSISNYFITDFSGFSTFANALPSLERLSLCGDGPWPLERNGPTLIETAKNVISRHSFRMLDIWANSWDKGQVSIVVGCANYSVHDSTKKVYSFELQASGPGGNGCMETALRNVDFDTTEDPEPWLHFDQQSRADILQGVLKLIAQATKHFTFPVSVYKVTECAFEDSCIEKIKEACNRQAVSLNFTDSGETK